MNIDQANRRRAHLICRRLDNAGHDGLDLIGTHGDRRVYRSDAWAITGEDANMLQGGYVYFHEHFVTPSTFGGEILWWCRSYNVPRLRRMSIA